MKKRRKKRYRYRLRPVRFTVTLLFLLACLAAGSWSVEALLQTSQPVFSFFTERVGPSGAQQVSLDLTQLHSVNAVLLDGASGRILAERSSEAIMYPASLTKMMTALVVIEHTQDFQTIVTVPDGLVQILRAEDASLAGFQSGEQARLQDLLYGMLLPSGAECCVTGAIAISGSEQQFVVLMNEKAQALGMEQTHFVNSTGLHDDAQYTTVKDMAILLRYALQNETFRTVFTCSRYVVPATNCHPDGFTMRSSLFELLEQLDCSGGVILGGKTGYTEKAGLCLATLANINGAEYLLVTAHADGNHNTEPYHVLDALEVYRQLGAQF